MGAQDQRPRFYEGQYLGAEDLAAIVDYLRAADARHALGAHTWGIAIGLYLVERPAAGPGREIILTPGVAWDGFGRAIVVNRPTRLPEEFCATIPFDDGLDGVATPKGRAVRVWLNYREIAARKPPPGFESCSDDVQNARVGETFDFVVGAFPEGSNRQASVTIGTKTLQAEEALQGFDASAPRLYDASVPHQTFPAAQHPPRWLVPVGLVRWVARDGDLGYYAARDGVPEYRMKDCTRAFRRYIGAVVENLVAADGAIVLQRRDKDPRKEHHKLAWLLNCGHKSEQLLEDLAWIEGNLRVVGNAKLAGGKLLMRDADGYDEGAPIYLDRSGDDASIATKQCCDDSGAVDAAALARSPREFRAAIGAKGQNAHRFIVGPELPSGDPKKPPSLAPRFVVLSGDGNKDSAQEAEGRAGVNTRDPAAALEVRGNWNATTNEDGAVRVSGNQPTIRYEGGDDVAKRKWITQITGNSKAKGAWRIAYRVPPAAAGGTPDWRGVVNVIVDSPEEQKGEKVGIRTDTPGAPLSVRAYADGQQDAVSLEDNSGAKKWTINLKPDANSGLNIAEFGGNPSSLFIKPGGNVGIGTTNPKQKLQVAGTAVVDGSLGVGTDTPQFGLDCTGWFRFGPGNDSGRIFAEYEQFKPVLKLSDFDDPPRIQFQQTGNGSEQSPQYSAWIGMAQGSSNKLALMNGNVGIGTTDPKQKLHAAGTAVVDGDLGVGISSPSYKLHVVGDVRCGTIIFDNWFWTSDARLKKNVEVLEGSLGRLCRLRGVSFEWAPEANRDPARRRELGVIAQEVAEVVPEAVAEIGEDKLGVSMTPLLALLIESVKELKGEVDELRDKVAALEGGQPKKDEKTKKKPRKNPED